jgi:preprotein translocase subunit SecA
MLGGNPDFIADAALHKQGLSPVETPEEYEQAWPDALQRAKDAVAAEHEQVLAAGGLYVLGTERHESRRIDNQLRGRGGRQGDPGLTRFYLSLEDDLMRMFGSGRVAGIMERLNIPPDQPIESKVVSRSIRSAQTQIEQQNFEIRKDVLKYDDVLNRQRKVIYAERRQVLEGADMHAQISTMLGEVVAQYVTGATAEGYPEEWDLEKLWRAFGQLYPVGVSIDEVIEEAGGDKAGLSGEFLTEVMQADALAAYERRENEYGAEVMREIERRVVLSVLDRKWREHLYDMDYLREGIGLRGYGQRDPLIEYQREGFDMFNAMMDGIREESVGTLFNVQVQFQENPIVEDTTDGTPGIPAGGPAPAAGPTAGGATAGRAGAQAAGTPAGPRHSAPAGARQAGAAAPRQGAPAGARPGAPAGPRAGGPAGLRAAGLGGAPTAPVVPAGLAPRRPQRMQYSGPSEDGGAPEVQGSRPGDGADPFATAGRNDPCPCGSGRKFKRCHGDPRNA